MRSEAIQSQELPICLRSWVPALCFSRLVISKYTWTNKTAACTSSWMYQIILYTIILQARQWGSNLLLYFCWNHRGNSRSMNSFMASLHFATGTSNPAWISDHLFSMLRMWSCFSLKCALQIHTLLTRSQEAGQIFQDQVSRIQNSMYK